MNLFRMVNPPDIRSAMFSGVWIALPYLAAVWLAVSMRRHNAVLIVLLITLLVCAVVGVYLLDASATGREVAAQQARDAVQPGEDPHHGPGGVRKANAELGEFVVSAFSILLVVVLPPIQLLAVLLLPIIAYGISALLRKRREPQVDPDRGEVG
jgi:hypothetical protein